MEKPIPGDRCFCARETANWILIKAVRNIKHFRSQFPDRDHQPQNKIGREETSEKSRNTKSKQQFFGEFC